LRRFLERLKNQPKRAEKVIFFMGHANFFLRVQVKKLKIELKNNFCIEKIKL